MTFLLLNTSQVRIIVSWSSSHCNRNKTIVIEQCYKINAFHFLRQTSWLCLCVCFGFGSWVLYHPVGGYYLVIIYFDFIVILKLVSSGPTFLVCLFNYMFKNLCKSCIKMTVILYCQHKPQSPRLMINSSSSLGYCVL